MTRGQCYRISKSFVDSDNDRHEEGEEWYYVGSFFNFYDEILSLHLADDDSNEWEIQLRPPECDQLKGYFQAIPNRFRTEYFATARCPGCKHKLERPAHCDACHEFWDPA